MKPSELLNILATAEKMKCNTRHSWTSSGRKESVAEHSWGLAFMAMLLMDEFPDLDMNKVIRMCLIHDLGEAFTGDIPTFEKTKDDEEKEQEIFENWLDTFPEPCRQQFRDLLIEMEERVTGEARIYKALDNLEAVIQHNEADLSTWLPLEYDLQFTYGSDKVMFSPYLMELKEEIDRQTREKIGKG
ncbi:MAG: HD family hydrolase [Fusicatenibacter sp.]